MDIINPDKLRPRQGRMIVKIVEKMGGEVKGGSLFLPPLVHDNMRKDTAIVQVLRMGPLPTRSNKTAAVWTKGRKGANWPEHYFPVQPGSYLMMPRDMPKVFVWKEERYAVCNMWEALLVIDDYSGHDSIEARIRDA